MTDGRHSLMIEPRHLLQERTVMTFKGLALRALRWPVITAVIALATLVTIPAFASAQPTASSQAPAAASAPKPTIVLVHGGWADGSSWGQVITILQREGYTV